MKIGLLSQWFDPETGPAAVPGIFAREFVNAGHEASVLTGYPNYPSGRIYEGYKQRFRSTSDHSGVRITRVPLIPSHDRSAAMRLANYASFALSATVGGAAALRDTDALWVYNSPITVSLPLLTHSKWGKKPFFLHVQDLWPDSLIESGMFPGGRIGRIADSVISAIVRLTERRAGAIGVISPSVRELILSRNPRADPARIVYVPNPADETLFVPLRELHGEVPEVPWRDKFTVMYSGALGDVQGLDTVLEAVKLLPAGSDIQMVIIGDGIARRRLEQQVDDRGIGNVTFVGRVPKEQIPGYMKTADIHLVSLGSNRFLEHTTPSKIASLLASEVPILGQIKGDGARLIEDSGAGLVTSPGNAKELSNLILQMARAPSDDLRGFASKGREYYEQHLSARMSASKVLTALGAKKIGENGI